MRNRRQEKMQGPHKVGYWVTSNWWLIWVKMASAMLEFKLTILVTGLYMTWLQTCGHRMMYQWFLKVLDGLVLDMCLLMGSFLCHADRKLHQLKKMLYRHALWIKPKFVQQVMTLFMTSFQLLGGDLAVQML